MSSPLWELEFSVGLLIAVISLLHVFVSHFAIGGGLFLEVTEHLAYRRGDSQLERYLQTPSRFLIPVRIDFGLLSGFGIRPAAGSTSAPPSFHWL